MPVVLSWSGGKDSALSLWTLRRELGTEPIALLTTVTGVYERVSMHGVRRELLKAQARAAALPLLEVEIPPACSNAVYEQRMAQALSAREAAAADEVAFGDLFLADIRAYREERLAEAGKRALFPLWGRDTATLARTFIEAGFRAVLVCVDPRQLDPAFAGREFDEQLLDELPASVDPCGENGEFHTFVYAGPIFARPLPVKVGQRQTREGFVFCDLLPN